MYFWKEIKALNDTFDAQTFMHGKLTEHYMRKSKVVLTGEIISRKKAIVTVENGLNIKCMNLRNPSVPLYR